METFTRLKQSIDFMRYMGVHCGHDDIARKLGRNRVNVTKAINGDSRYLTRSFLRSFAAAYSDYINEDWLLTGEGRMEKKLTFEVPSDLTDGYLSLVNKIINDKGSLRPHIPADKAVVAAGFVGSAIGSVQEGECEVRPVMAPLPWYDFTIEVSGDSMEPTLRSGDTIACEWLHDSTEFVHNRIYVLDTAEGAVVKRVERKGNTLHCHSDNLEYPDFDVPVDIILRSARVVGLVRSL